MPNVISAAGPHGPRVDILTTLLTDFAISPATAEVGFQVRVDGDEYTFTGFGVPFALVNTWLLKGSAGDYDTRYSVSI